MSGRIDAGVPEVPETLWVLEGPGLGDVAMEDVATFLAGIVKAVELACGHAVGRQVKETGRRESVIESARRVRLTTIQSGSLQVYGVHAQLPPPPPGSEDTLGLEVETVSERGLSIAQEAASTKGGATFYQDVARAWVSLSDDLDLGGRFERIRIEDLRPKKHRRTVIIDPTARDRLRRATMGPTLRQVTTNSLRGYLFEANFDRHTAQLRTAAGELVEVTFGPEHADAIQSALRHQPLVKGQVTYDPRTNRATSVQVRDIDMGEQLDLFRLDFWNDTTIQDLRRGAGAPGVTDASSLRLDLTDQERADLLALVTDG